MIIAIRLSTKALNLVLSITFQTKCVLCLILFTGKGCTFSKKKIVFVKINFFLTIIIKICKGMNKKLKIFRMCWSFFVKQIKICQNLIFNRNEKCSFYKFSTCQWFMKIAGQKKHIYTKKRSFWYPDLNAVSRFRRKTKVSFYAYLQFRKIHKRTKSIIAVRIFYF